MIRVCIRVSYPSSLSRDLPLSLSGQNPRHYEMRVLSGGVILVITIMKLWFAIPRAVEINFAVT